MKWCIKMNIAIVDDEQQEIDLFSSVIKEYSIIADVEITVSAFHSAEEFIKGYRPLAYTAVFMDIFMSGMTGMDAARKILEADRHAMIIFLTSSDGFMGDALSIHAYDYIEKPAEKTRIFKVMDDILMKQSEYDSTPRFSFTSDRQDYAIPYPDIMYIRTAERNYLDIAAAPHSSYKARLSFASAQQELSKDTRFITVTRGVMVNLDFVSSVEDNVCILEDGERFPIALNVAGNFKNIWQNYQLDSLRNERMDAMKRKLHSSNASRRLAADHREGAIHIKRRRQDK